MKDQDLYFDDVESLRRVNRTHRLVNNMENKQQLSGCIFGCIGLIVLGFSFYLINKGISSRLYEEIDDYVGDVKAWKS